MSVRPSVRQSRSGADVIFSAPIKDRWLKFTGNKYILHIFTKFHEIFKSEGCVIFSHKKTNIKLHLQLTSRFTLHQLQSYKKKNKYKKSTF